MASSAPGDVLIVDGDPSIRGLLQVLIQRMGHRAVVAADGRAALDLLATHSFAAIVLDLRLPGISGGDVLAHLAEARPEVLPRIVVTTTAVTGRDGVFRDVGAILRKPFQIDQMMEEVSRCCDGDVGGH
jgi:DNA-binding NtrC family response regulator